MATMSRTRLARMTCSSMRRRGGSSHARQYAVFREVRGETAVDAGVPGGRRRRVVDRLARALRRAGWSGLVVRESACGRRAPSRHPPAEERKKGQRCDGGQIEFRLMRIPPRLTCAGIAAKSARGPDKGISCG